jgi:hypothetical protein
MDRQRAGDGERGDERTGARRRPDCDAARGAVHSFVEISELRRIMGRLTAIEMLRLLLAGDASSYGA